MTTNEYRELVHDNTEAFKPKEALNVIYDWLRDYAKANNMTKAVLGVSGGKDSTVVAAILVKVLGNENVFGLLMPNGEQKDIEDSLTVCDLLGIEHEVFNIAPVYEAEIVMLGGIENVSVDALINIAPRIRMTTLYTYGQTHGYRVAGTGNLSERTLGYFTKWGDGGSDFNIIGGFTSLEVMRIGEELGLPLELVYKTPADGLSGQSDEERLGVTYIDVHNFLRKGIGTVTYEVANKISDMSNRAKHKLTDIPIVEYAYKA